MSLVSGSGGQSSLGSSRALHVAPVVRELHDPGLGEPREQLGAEPVRAAMDCAVAGGVIDEIAVLLDRAQLPCLEPVAHIAPVVAVLLP